jgi:hypothetical protein
VSPSLFPCLLSLLRLTFPVFHVSFPPSVSPSLSSRPLTMAHLFRPQLDWHSWAFTVQRPRRVALPQPCWPTAWHLTVRLHNTWLEARVAVWNRTYRSISITLLGALGLADKSLTCKPTFQRRLEKRLILDRHVGGGPHGPWPCRLLKPVGGLLQRIRVACHRPRASFWAAPVFHEARISCPVLRTHSFVAIGRLIG